MEEKGIHPIFRPENFRCQKKRHRILPALKVASRLIRSKQARYFWSHVFFATHRKHLRLPNGEYTSNPRRFHLSFDRRSQLKSPTTWKNVQRALDDLADHVTFRWHEPEGGGLDAETIPHPSSYIHERSDVRINLSPTLSMGLHEPTHDADAHYRGQFFIGVVLAHEVAHAGTGVHHHNWEWGSYTIGKCQSDEDGFEMEKLLFGGRVTRRLVVDPTLGGIADHTHVSSWPNPDTVNDYAGKVHAHTFGKARGDREISIEYIRSLFEDEIDTPFVRPKLQVPCSSCLEQDLREALHEEKTEEV